MVEVSGPELELAIYLELVPGQVLEKAGLGGQAFGVELGLVMG